MNTQDFGQTNGYPLEEWRVSMEFPSYEVSNYGTIRRISDGLIMSQSKLTNGELKITLSTPFGGRRTRLVKRIVADAFVKYENRAVDTTVIQLDNNKDNCCAWNLMWRPRWFAWKYTAQFNSNIPDHVLTIPIKNTRTNEVYPSVLVCAMTEGMLIEDILRSAETWVLVYPTRAIYQYLNDKRELPRNIVYGKHSL